MAFLDTLREYLQELHERPTRHADAAPPGLEPAEARRHLIRCLERIEEQAQAKGGPISTERYEQILNKWQEEDLVVRFAKRMRHLLLAGMSHGASARELKTQIEVALARRLGLPDALPSDIRTLELDRLSVLAYTEVLAQIRGWLPSVNIEAYAEAIRATRGTGTSLALTPIGRVFLEFTGRDAIRWLLQVEVVQSTGPGDEWRVSRETARALVRKTEWTLNWGGPNPDFPHSLATIRRLDALGLVKEVSDLESERMWVSVLPVGQELLGEVESEAESPMSILAKSLLADLTLSAAQAVSKSALEDAGARASAAEATARQARLVAHEIRNALVPVKTSLGALYREMLLSPPSETLARRREGIDRGIDAVFRFVEQLVRLSELAAKPPEPFDPLPVIRDAVSLVESETGRRIEQVLPSALPPVSGHRDRVVMAITNVLRNAAQAVTGPAAIVRIGAEPADGGRAVLVSIEDNGPGVPETMRQAIFEEGISLRPGGSGMGLALVREVFEKEMKGLVDCGASHLGGARFVIRMPTAGAE
jgi:signal transduction histidine kinase